VRKLAKWKNIFPADLVVWQEGKPEATGVPLDTVLSAHGA